MNAPAHAPKSPSPSTKERPRRPRAALVAYACAPGRGSEEEVGWQWTRHAPPWIDACIFTRGSSWDGIPGKIGRHEGLPCKVVEGRTYLRVEVPILPRFLGPHRLVRLHSLVWQLAVLRHLVRHRSNYDLVHHVTFVAIWMPALGAFAGLPFVWGPLGTNLPLPDWFRPRGFFRRLRLKIRRWVTERSPRLNPLVRAGHRRARRLIVVHERLLSHLDSGVRPRAIVHPAIGVSDSWIADPPVPRTRRTRRVLFVGRYIDSKLPEFVLDVATRLVRTDPDVRITMVGSGLPNALGTGHPDRLEVWSERPVDEIRRLMDDSRVLFFPSFEASGFVVLEALARGLPVVCLDGTGPSSLAGPAGVSRPIAGSWDDAARDAVETIRRLLDEDETWDRASLAATAQAARLRWGRLSEILDETYRGLGQPSAV